MPIIMVAAMGEKRQIWNGDRFPWGKKFIPADMRRFRELTLYKKVVLGRVTCDAIKRDGFWPLKSRQELIVMTRDINYVAEGARIVHDISEILELSKTEDIYVIGGAEIYSMFEPHAAEMHLTIVLGDFPGTVHFPDYDQHVWKEKVPAIEISKNETSEFSLKFLVLHRAFSIT